jgi:ABC-type sugar transport system ATPase subunit
MPDPAPLLSMEGISKSFPGVQALTGVPLALHAGEVLALLGENGAGKSTLIKILAGAHAPDGGTIQIRGAPAAIRNPVDARRRGVAVIYQELNLVPTLTATENIFLGCEPARFGVVRKNDERSRARELFDRLGVDVDPAAPCRTLSVAQQQAVEIAKALATDARILVMDEPTAPLTPREVDRLFGLIRDLKTRGLGIIFISHRLDEVFAIADRVTVLRDGRHVVTCPVAGLTRDRLITWMVGRALEQEFPPRQVSPGPVRLEVHGLCRGRVRDVSFVVRAGEVVGLTGLVGAGRTETARAIFGADRRDAGDIRLDGQVVTIRSPADAIRAGLCLLPEDRKSQGLIVGQSVLANFGLPNLAAISRFGVVHRPRERDAFAQYVNTLGIKVADVHAPAKNLSGGNQQKVVLAKWLHRNCNVVIFDEPTRGIDVGAKYEIYQLINGLAAAGKAVLLISSELPEVLGMADRVLVMREGHLTGEIADARGATQEQIMRLAVG